MRRPHSRATIVLLAAGLLSAVLAAGCSREEAPQAPVVRKPVSREAAKAAEAPPPGAVPPKPAPVVLFDPAGKRDPFVPFLKGEVQAPQAPRDHLPPLQRYELGELKFVGVLWGGKGYRGLIEDSEGKGYTVMLGTRVGRNGGVVTRITDGAIVVKETFTDYQGSKVERESTLKLQTAGGR